MGNTIRVMLHEVQVIFHKTALTSPANALHFLWQLHNKSPAVFLQLSTINVKRQQRLEMLG